MTPEEFVTKKYPSLDPTNAYVYSWIKEMEEYTDQETADLRKELETERELNGSEIALLREANKFCKDMAEAQHDSYQKERAKSAKLIEAFKGKGFYFEDSGFGDSTYSVSCSHLFESREEAEDFIKSLAPFENDKTQQS